MNETRFPNGFTSWYETHHEIVCAINGILQQEEIPHMVPWMISNEQGTGGIYEYCVDITDEFEKIHEGVEWEADYFDVLEQFIDQKVFGEPPAK